jgi:hypothetical protein
VSGRPPPCGWRRTATDRRSAPGWRSPLRALLHHLPEGGPEGLVVLGPILRHLLQQAQHLLHGAGAHAVDQPVVLQDLPGDIERQVIGIHHAAHEPQVARHELLGIVHDEHPAHIELDAMATLPVPQVEGRPLGDIEQCGVFLPALHPVVGPGQRILEVMGHMLVEGPVLVVRDLRTRPRPEGRGPVDGLLFLPGLALLVQGAHPDGQGDVVGVAGDDVAQAVAVQELVLVRLEMQHDLGAPARRLHGLDAVLAGTVGDPAHPVLRPHAGTPGGELHPFGHDERGVEPHAELADQVGIPGLVAGQAGEKLLGAGLGDGADVVDHLLAAHADAVVAHRDGARLGIEVHFNGQIPLSFHERVICKRFEPQLVAGVGAVGDQLAQEDLLVGVQRVDHQVQQLTHFCLETQGLLVSRYGHGYLLPNAGVVKLRNLQI